MREIIFVSTVLGSLLLTGVADHRLILKTSFMERERSGRRGWGGFVEEEEGRMNGGLEELGTLRILIEEDAPCAST